MNYLPGGFLWAIEDFWIFLSLTPANILFQSRLKTAMATRIRTVQLLALS